MSTNYGAKLNANISIAYWFYKFIRIITRYFIYDFPKMKDWHQSKWVFGTKVLVTTVALKSAKRKNLKSVTVFEVNTYKLLRIMSHNTLPFLRSALWERLLPLGHIAACGLICWAGLIGSGQVKIQIHVHIARVCFAVLLLFIFCFFF